MSSSEYENCSPSPPPPPREQYAFESATKPSVSKSGILSNVFSFVSREITEFVVNATGVAEASNTRPVAGPSRERSGLAHKTEKRYRRQSTPSHSRYDSRASKRVRTSTEEQSDSTKSREDHGVYEVEHDVSGFPGQWTRLSPSQRAQRPRKTSLTMPGSLFSRSPTPDDPTDTRHVRFAKGIVSPVPRRQRPISRCISQVEDERPQDEGLEQEAEDEEQYEEEDAQWHGDENCESRPSSHRSMSRHAGFNTNHPPSSSRRLFSVVAGPSSQLLPATPFRPPSTNPVIDVFGQPDNDSPRRPLTPGSSTKGKGKAQQVGNVPHISWPLIDRDSTKDGDSASRSDVTYGASLAMGSGEDIQRSEAVVRRGTGEKASVEYPKGDHPTINGEEAKKRIRELEERVRTLESELASRPPQRETDAPPPPPPPPPPLPLGSTSRISLASSPRRGPGVSNVLVSVRAGLKTPNIPEVSKVIPKNRLPTVPADKMEKFLSELKTVKLRRVGSPNQSTASSSSRLEHSQSFPSQGRFLAVDRPNIGYKRKRLDSGQETQSSLVTSLKRRFTVPSQTPATSTPSMTSSSMRCLFPATRPSVLGQRRTSTVMSAVPPEVDGTTPSLCSDNDNEAEDRAPSTPPSLPSRPSVCRMVNRVGDQQVISAPAAAEVSVELPAPGERHREHEIRGMPSRALRKTQSTPPSAQPLVRDHSLPPLSTELVPGRQSPRPPEATNDPFSRRPPSSPMLPETPRRPRPPGRTRSGSKPARHASIRSRSLSPSGDVNGDDPLSLSFAPREESTPALSPVGRRRPPQGQAAQRQRRVTLDEEIRRVDSNYSDEERAVNEAEVERRESDYSDEERAMQDLESGVLLGVGRRSKRLGFLAHGGAGGAPVLMGVGYVEGAMAEDQEVSEQKTKEAETGKGKRQIRSNARGKRKAKR